MLLSVAYEIDFMRSLGANMKITNIIGIRHIVLTRHLPKAAKGFAVGENLRQLSVLPEDEPFSQCNPIQNWARTHLKVRPLSAIGLDIIERFKSGIGRRSI
jgi:hypothetical protein